MSSEPDHIDGNIDGQGAGAAEPADGAAPAPAQASPPVSLNGLRTMLADAFNPAAAGQLDAVLRLEIQGRSLSFRVSNRSLDFDVPAGTAADATFLFDDQETALALLSGQGDTFGAFMDGRFRSDGYLMWAFVLLGMFRAASPTPVDLE